MQQEFQMTYLGRVHDSPGIEVNHIDGCYGIYLGTYIDNLIKQWWMQSQCYHRWMWVT